jgi:U4/U6 small nuclear ribonucleoprotein PRP31
MADALLDDLDDLSDVQSDTEPPYGDVYSEGNTRGGNYDDDNYRRGNNDESGGDYNYHRDAMSGVGGDPSAVSSSSSSLRVRPRLLDDSSLQLHLSSVRAVSNRDDGEDRKHSASATTSKDDEERQHALILASNRHLVSLGHEIHRTYLDLCRLYHPKFPELEELISDPFQYRAVIGILQNDMDVTRSNDKLNDILTSNQIITISVAGSTTSGRLLTDDEMSMLHSLCVYLDDLKWTWDELTNFVESRASRWSPNVCALIGPAIAAKLLATAGGLGELCRVPACNLQLLGRKRSAIGGGGGVSSSSTRSDGMATKAREQHAGYLMECDLVISLPNYLGMKAAKAVAGKLALAARADHVNVETGRRRTSDVGRRLREELVTKFHKWEEPDRAQVVKALPKPDLTTKKRRGGKRIRRLKERFEETDMMKHANRRAFSAESGEYGDDAMGLTLGMLDSKEAGGGPMRNTVEKKKMRYANTKASRKKAVQMMSSSGLASSMVFTPSQGLELVNPDANRERVRLANANWFSDSAGFQSALPKKS